MATAGSFLSGLLEGWEKEKGRERARSQSDLAAERLRLQQEGINIQKEKIEIQKAQALQRSRILGGQTAREIKKYRLDMETSKEKLKQLQENYTRQIAKHNKEMAKLGFDTTAAEYKSKEAQRAYDEDRAGQTFRSQMDIRKAQTDKAKAEAGIKQEELKGLQNPPDLTGFLPYFAQRRGLDRYGLNFDMEEEDYEAISDAVEGARDVLTLTSEGTLADALVNQLPPEDSERVMHQYQVIRDKIGFQLLKDRMMESGVSLPSGVRPTSFNFVPTEDGGWVLRVNWVNDETGDTGSGPMTVDGFTSTQDPMGQSNVIVFSDEQVDNIFANFHGVAKQYQAMAVMGSAPEFASDLIETYKSYITSDIKQAEAAQAVDLKAMETLKTELAKIEADRARPMGQRAVEMYDNLINPNDFGVTEDDANEFRVYLNRKGTQDKFRRSDPNDVDDAAEYVDWALEQKAAEDQRAADESAADGWSPGKAWAAVEEWWNNARLFKSESAPQAGSANASFEALSALAGPELLNALAEYRGADNNYPDDLVNYAATLPVGHPMRNLLVR